MARSDAKSVADTAVHGHEQDMLTEIWHRHRERLLRRAAWWLRRRPGLVDAEDVVISAVGSVCRRLQNDPETKCEDSERNLLGLLLRIIDRKAINYWHWERREKRGGGRVRQFDQQAESYTTEAVGTSSAGRNSASQRACEAVDALEVLLEGADETLQRIVMMRLDGMTLEEIAEVLDISTATVSRKLTRVRNHWERVLQGASDDANGKPAPN